MGTKVCMFTGHREIKESDMSDISEKLSRLLEVLINEGYTDFRAGGAIGFDTIAALKVIEKKEKYPAVKLHLYLPCRDQDKRWKESSRTAYEFVKSHADSIIYTSELYVRGCMQKRNRMMVDGSDLCVAYYRQKGDGKEEQISLFGSAPDKPLSKAKGGTEYTVLYAEKNKVKVVNLA